MTAALMIQGTGSDVGKSLLVAGIARALNNRGLKVKPFKPQNMSNNAAITIEGGEIGRAQALQARAARTPLQNDMNPVLLKPQTEIGAQVVVQGKVWGNANAHDYQSIKPTLLPQVLESFERLKKDTDLVIVEGAGSPAEINLRKNDIANMGFAEAADIPVLLAGDIDRGGVIAQIVGTYALLSETEKARTRGFLINKFRGDPTLFDDGLTILEERTGWQNFGVIPFFKDAYKLPPEDAFSIQSQLKEKVSVNIAIPVLSRIANYDDFDPLIAEPDVNIHMVKAGEPLPTGMDLVILPGSKATLADMQYLRAQGWDTDILSHIRHGGSVIGICGGYQMLGTELLDPEGREGNLTKIDGLGLLDFKTTMTGNKKLLEESGTEHLTKSRVRGYHMHLGDTFGPALERPMLHLQSGPDGVISKDGAIMGSYLHGLFANDEFRTNLINRFRRNDQKLERFEIRIEQTLDHLADHLEKHIAIDRLLEIAGC
ncbi:cobyric acid synthase CobQ [Alphaproteobacteria bacterium 46_93_T64]|nr:cobyric acid synthase CobQ [Alphaproteobacteria bacterium 46_93_T64]